MSGSSSDLVTVDYTDGSSSFACMARVQPAIGAAVHTTGGSDSRSLLRGLVRGAEGLVSVHRLIERSGQVDLLYSLDKVCFHLGQTWWPPNTGRLLDPANEVFIGYELECLDSQAPTYQQIDALASIIVADGLTLGWRWPYNIYGHYALALPLGRRSDPVRLDWGGFMGRLYFRAQQAGVGGL